MLEVVFDRYSSNNNTFSNSIFNPILYNNCLMSQFCQFDKIMSQKENEILCLIVIPVIIVFLFYSPILCE